jgi:hypothetical protein
LQNGTGGFTDAINKETRMNLKQRDNLLLLNAVEVETEEGGAANLAAADRQAYKTILEWTRAFLCRPHVDLGREGPVCPFTQPSLNQKLFWVTMIRGSEINQLQAGQAIEYYRDLFLELEPKTGPASTLKAILILFPDITHEKASVDMEALQKRLKPDFVKKGLMIGQFYKGCPESGLWSDSFRPLQSPLPLLAIRNMVPSDFPFLHGKRGNEGMLISYLNRFGTRIPPEVKDFMVRALQSSNLSLASNSKLKKEVSGSRNGPIALQEECR